MGRPLLLLLLLVFAITVTGSANAEVFTDSGLVDIPTGRVLEHGIFGAGTFVALRQSATVSGLQTPSTNLADVLAIRLNFGLFDRIEVGLRHMWNEYDAEHSTEQAVSLKAQLLKEQEVGVIPSIAVGIEYLSDGILASDSEKMVLCRRHFWLSVKPLICRGSTSFLVISVSVHSDLRLKISL